MSICIDRLQDLLRAYEQRQLDANAFVEDVFRVLGEGQREQLTPSDRRYIHGLLNRLEERGLAPAEACHHARELFPLRSGLTAGVPTVEEFSSAADATASRDFSPMDGEDDGYDDVEEDTGWGDDEGHDATTAYRTSSGRGLPWGRILATGLVLGVLLGLAGGAAVLILPQFQEKQEKSRQMAIQQATAMALEGLTSVQQELAAKGKNEDLLALAATLETRTDLVTEDGWRVELGPDPFNGRIMLIVYKDDDKELINLFLCDGRFQMEDCYEPL